MSSFFCDNPKCQHHVEVPKAELASGVLTYSVYGKMSSKIAATHRHPYVRDVHAETVEELFNLCDTCHAAVHLFCAYR